MAAYDDGCVRMAIAVDAVRPNWDETEAIALRGAVLALHGPGIVVGESAAAFADMCGCRSKRNLCWFVGGDECRCATDPQSCPRIRGVV